METNLTKKVTSIENMIVELIKKASSKIFISTWLLNSDKIKDTLIQTSKRLKGHIYIITALEQNYFHYKFSDDMEECEEYNFSTLETLKGRNNESVAVEIRGHRNAHAKFIIIDDEKLVLTSANLTYSSLEITGNQRFHKNEVGLYITDKNIVKNISSLFKTIYMQNAQAHLRFQDNPLIRIPLYTMKNRDFLKKMQSDSSLKNLTNYKQGNFFVWTLPDDFSPSILNRNLIEDTIVKIIEEEIETLNICSYSWNIVKDSIIWKSLIEKLHNKNFECNLIINKPRNKEIDENLDYLKKNYLNFRLYFHSNLHAKFILSKEYWLLTSANFDMEYGLKNSIEVGILSNNQRIYTQLSTFFIQLKNEAEEQ